MRLVSLIAVLCALAACATSVSSECKRRMTDCLRRCESADPDTRPAKTVRPPDITLTACEDRCSKCGAPAAGNAPPAGQPTFTGTAQPR